MPSPISIIFCGTPDFAVPSLKAIADDPAFSIELVITQPDKPVGRKQILTPPPIKVEAEQYSIPVMQPENLTATRYPLATRSPDYLVVVAFGQILNSDWLLLPKIAPINVHASLLPHWRGASPIQNALLAGEKETGITIQRMVQKLDAGPILAQRTCAIEPRETSETLFQKLAEEGARLLVETLKNPQKEIPQDEAQATFCRKLTRTDGIVDTSTMTAEEIDRKVRALSPWPGVTCPVGNGTVKILETALQESRNAVAVPCAGGTTLFVEQLQVPGKKPMSGAEWRRGCKQE